MLVVTPTVRRHCVRTQSGSQIMEFAAGMIILVFFVFIPLLDLTIVPIRWMLAQELVKDYARKLALCETFSRSYRTMEADPSLTTRLKRLGGVSVESLNLRLRITRVFQYPRAPEVFAVEDPTKIPAEWLPDGANAPCSYSLELDVRSLMSPAILLPSKEFSIPGLTVPFPLLIPQRTNGKTWDEIH